MNICIIGTGYVGLVTGTCFAEMGNQVWCIDADQHKVETLQKGAIPIYEPGLEELVRRNRQETRLHFSTNLEEGLKNALFCFIAVGTPPLPDGSVDIRQVLQAAKEIGSLMTRKMIVITKSTVPVGTSAQVRAVIAEQLELREQAIEFDVVSNPEFLKEGAAIEDFMRPDRVVIGAENPQTAELMKKLYEPFVRNQNPVLVMDIASAELTKYAANAMLATRISFMNEMAQLCDQVGANIANVRLGIGTDRRIGMPFLYAGPGYGGSCFPKDVKELIHTGKRNQVAMEVIQAVDRANERQKKYLVELIKRRFGDDLSGMTFAIWGLAFKPQTDDIRESPALIVIKELIRMGAKIQAYDPEAMRQAQKVLAEYAQQICYADSMLGALRDADAMVLVTEWRQFRQPDFSEMQSLMRQPVVFDGRNQYNPQQMTELGFEYYCIGRNCLAG